MEKITASCMVCSGWKEVRHIPIYVIGSEGLVVCHDCEMKIVDFIRKLMRSNAIRRKRCDTG